MRIRSIALAAVVAAAPLAMPSPAQAVTRNATILSDPRCMRVAKTICVDEGARAIYAVQNKRVVKAYSAYLGRPGYRTRKGVHRVYWKSRNHVSSIYGSPMPYALFFSGGQAVHFSPTFAARGFNYPGSHGCVNMRSKKGARWLFDWAPVGTRVLVTS